MEAIYWGMAQRIPIVYDTSTQNNEPIQHISTVHVYSSYKGSISHIYLYIPGATCSFRFIYKRLF